MNRAAALAETVLRRLFSLRREMLFSRELKGAEEGPGPAPGLIFEVVTPGMHGQVRELMRPYMDFVTLAYFWRSFPRKKIYLVRGEDGILHYGRVLLGRERAREVRLKDGEAYIGPCFTVPEARGRGIYPFALGELARILARVGYSRVYIAADRENAPSISGIEKAGFTRVCEGYLVRLIFFSFFVSAS